MTLFYKARGQYATYLKLSFIYMVRSIFDTSGIPEYLTLFLGMGQFSYHQRASDLGRSSQRIQPVIFKYFSAETAELVQAILLEVKRDTKKQEKHKTLYFGK